MRVKCIWKILWQLWAAFPDQTPYNFKYHTGNISLLQSCGTWVSLFTEIAYYQTWIHAKAVCRRAAQQTSKTFFNVLFMRNYCRINVLLDKSYSCQILSYRKCCRSNFFSSVHGYFTNSHVSCLCLHNIFIFSEIRI